MIISRLFKLVFAGSISNHLSADICYCINYWLFYWNTKSDVECGIFLSLDFLMALCFVVLAALILAYIENVECA